MYKSKTPWLFLCYQTFIILVVRSASAQKLPDRTIFIAEPVAPQMVVSEDSQALSITGYTKTFLLTHQQVTELLLNQAILRNDMLTTAYLLDIYKQFPAKDDILVHFAEGQLAKHHQNYQTAIQHYREILSRQPELTSVRVQLAICLFYTQQDNLANEQFHKILSDNTLPQDIAMLVQQYLNILEKRDSWQINLSMHYQHDSNINHVSSDPYIENTAFKKNNAMLPQKAKGIGYALSAQKDINLWANHYLHFSTILAGKNYWNNHTYDEITSRTYLGYSYKQYQRKFSLLPFYEQQWYSNHRYKRGLGLRTEYLHWFTPHWQLSTALEYSKETYPQSPLYNGNNKLLSLTLVWQVNPQRYLYLGGDLSYSKAQHKQDSYKLNTLRLGWGEEWHGGISSRINVSFSQRSYQDHFSLGQVFYFDRPRKDQIRQVNMSLWKRDWHLWGITPKLTYQWRQQKSNFASLYSYRDNLINIVFEKNF